MAMISKNPEKTIDLKSLTPRGIDRFCSDTLGQKPGQGTRVAVWLYRRKIETFDAMEDLNKSLEINPKQSQVLAKRASVHMEKGMNISNQSG